MLFNQMLLEEEKRLMQLKKDLEKKLEKAPEGKLAAFKRGKKWRWYMRATDHNKAAKQYIAATEEKLLTALAQKEAVRRQLLDTTQQLEAMKRYKATYNRDKQNGKYLCESRYEKLKAEAPGIWELLQDEAAQKWQNEPFTQLETYAEQKKFPSNQGLLTRSKSESIIATVLEDMNIPFHYEERLMLKASAVYPDFTLRHPSSGRILYWEHFGMMDDINYKAETVRKISRYIDAGIIPGSDIVFSFETKDEPMNFRKVKAYVEYMIHNMG